MYTEQNVYTNICTHTDCAEMNDIIFFENVAREQCLDGQLSGPPEPLGDLGLLRYQTVSSE